MFCVSLKPGHPIEGALEAQRAKYEKELAQLKEQLESAHLKESGHPTEQLGPSPPRDQLSIQPKDQSESVQVKDQLESVQVKGKMDPVQPKETQYREQQETAYPHEQLASSAAAPARLPTMSTPVLPAKHKPPRS